MYKNKNFANKYSSELYAKTKFYQKKYGFQIGTGKHDTWNNEADAFKHAFGSADIALKSSSFLSKYIGDYHENSLRDNPKNEENMDKWNNQAGRDIAKEISKEYNQIEIILLSRNGKLNDIIAEKVMQKMRAGKLITNPNDKRKYVEGKVTGFASDIGHTFTREEIKGMNSEEYLKNEKAIMKQLNTRGIPYKKELEKEKTKEKNYSNKEGRWVTINRNHVLIEK